MSIADINLHYLITNKFELTHKKNNFLTPELTESIIIYECYYTATSCSNGYFRNHSAFIYSGSIWIELLGCHTLSNVK